MRIHRKEEGAALVEFALIATLLFTILFGIVEFGLAFRDWLSITSSTREGARVASAAGNDPLADCFILDAMTGPLLAIQVEDLSNNFKVRIFKADSNGDYQDTAPQQVYQPDPLSISTNPFVCNANWDKVSGTYESTTRGVVSGNLDSIGVRIEFTHQWVTGFFTADPDWIDDAVMRMEPKSFAGP